MRVIICGAGQVGYNIASYLALEDNDVTVVDMEADLISRINDTLDVNGIVGHASNPNVLSAAGAKDADMMIAVTQSDEVNMVACQIGHSLFGIPKKIARIREQAYLAPEWSNLFSRAHMPLDVIISPEVVIANDIQQRLEVPGTTFVTSLAEGRAYLIGVVCNEDCPIVNTPIDQIQYLFPDLSFQIMALRRNNKAHIPDKRDFMEVGDEVFFIVSKTHLKRTMGVFGHEEKEARRIIIAGGGNIGMGLAKLLRKSESKLNLKIIDHNVKRAEILSKNLEDVIVLNGSALEKRVLEEAGISGTDTFIAVTNDDESNILGSLLAKQYGCKRVITLVNNDVYSPLVGPLGVDAMVSPRSLLVSTIMQHVRRGRIKGLYNLRDGFAEVLEAEVSDTSSIVNLTVDEINLTHEIIVGGIIRNGEFHVPKGEMKVQARDVVTILASRSQIHNVEKMFSVQVDLF
tara:strand:- start:531 stop:1907 length:1377 start_codon:yes stop_codon:yes gene_type:complete